MDSANPITHNATLQEGIVDDGGAVWPLVTESHGGLIVVDSIVDTAHKTLIIPEEEDGQRGNAVDGDQETAFLILVHHIPLRNGVHGSGCDASPAMNAQRVRHADCFGSRETPKNDVGNRKQELQERER